MLILGNWKRDTFIPFACIRYNINCFTMNFTSPFPKVEPVTFKFTFLREVGLEVTFKTAVLTDDSKSEYWLRFKDFAKDKFKLDIPNEYRPGNSEIFSKDAETKFVFNYEQGCVGLQMGSKRYVMFDTTLVEYLKIIILYLNDVACVKDVNKLVLRKTNVFPFTSKGCSMKVKDILHATFKPEHAADFNKKKGGVGELVKEIKDIKIGLGEDTALLLTLGYEVVDGENVNVLFNMCSEYEPKGHMAVDDVSETAKALNDIMYDAFIYYISEQVCAIMKKAN